MKLPFLPLRNCLVFPESEQTLYVGRESSLKSIESAALCDNKIVVCAQRDESNTLPSQASELYEWGTLCKIVRVNHYSGESSKVILLGEAYCKIVSLSFEKDHLWATGDVTAPQPNSALTQSEVNNSLKALKSWFGEALDQEAEEQIALVEKENSLWIHTHLLCAALMDYSHKSHFRVSLDPNETNHTVENLPHKHRNFFLRRQDLFEVLDPRAKLQKALELMSSETLAP
jgi:ATP-dependent Lon protease